MSNRHLSRTIAMQSLYQWDFLRDQPDRDLDAILAFNQAEFANNFDDGGFAAVLAKGVLEKQAAIDEMITRFAPHWPIESLTIVDRNILRLGIFELLHSENVPSKVAINEAIELAKGFGGGSSGRFVNGVLGAIYKDMVEQGKLKEIDKQEAPKKAVQDQEEKPQEKKLAPAAADHEPSDEAQFDK